MRHSILRRLALVAIASLLVLAVAEAVAVVSVIKNVEATRQVRASLREIDMLQQLRLSVAHALMPPNDHLIAADPAERVAFDAAIENVEAELALARSTLSEPLRAMVGDQLLELRRLGLEIFDRPAPEGSSERQHQMKEFDAVGVGLVATLDMGLGPARTRADEAAAFAARVTRHSTRALIALGVLDVLATVPALLLIGRSIARRARLLTDRLRRVAEDDLSAGAAQPERDELGELANALNTAVANVKTARERHARTERMAAIGELVVAMRHEINNPLQGILSTAELLQGDLAKQRSGDLTEPLEAIRQGCLELSARIERLSAAMDRPTREFLAIEDTSAPGKPPQAH